MWSQIFEEKKYLMLPWMYFKHVKIVLKANLNKISKSLFKVHLGQNSSFFLSETLRWKLFCLNLNFVFYSMQCTTVQCSALQYSAVHYSTVQSTTVQCSALQYSAVHYSTVQCITVQCSALQYSAVQWSSLQCLQYNKFQCSIVHYEEK